MTIVHSCMSHNLVLVFCTATEVCVFCLVHRLLAIKLQFAAAAIAECIVLPTHAVLAF